MSYFSVSESNRKLMEEILKRSQDDQNQMSTRVTALLAGSALTTTAGVRIERRDTIEQVDYTAVGKSKFLLFQIFFLFKKSLHFFVFYGKFTNFV